MIKVCGIILVVLSIFLVNSTSYAQCPPINDSRHNVMNGYGDSSYIDSNVKIMLNIMLNKFELNLSKPALDAGAGYGAATYELIKLGAKKIYLNDLSSDTLQCANNHLQALVKDKKAEVITLAGSITNKKIKSKILDNSLGLIYSADMVQFMTIEDMVDFYHLAFSKLAKNGLFYIQFGNQFMVEQEAMVSKIHKEINSSNGKVDKETIVKKIFKDTAFTKWGIFTHHCSYSSYDKLPKNIKSYGFPCEMHHPVDGKVTHMQLLTFNYIQGILTKMHFTVIANNNGIVNNEEEFIIAKKV